MSYVPQVGDTVQLIDSQGGVIYSAIKVTATGTELLLGSPVGGEGEYAYALRGSGTWVKVTMPEPLPERWINIYPYGWINNYSIHGSLERVEATTSPGAIARLHVWTSEDGVDHAEIVRLGGDNAGSNPVQQPG